MRVGRLRARLRGTYVLLLKNIYTYVLASQAYLALVGSAADRHGLHPHPFVPKEGLRWGSHRPRHAEAHQ